MDERLQKIKKQIEFYFGDSNLPNDRFLREQIASDNDGYVKLDVLCKFKRLSVLKATPEDIVKIFDGSSFLKTSEDGTGIKRLTPLPAVDDSASRKLHVKGFPLDVDQIELEKFFDELEPNGVAAVRMLRGRNRETTKRVFYGAVFVEFKTAENMNSVLKREKDLKFRDLQLEVKTFDDFIRFKEEKKKKKKKRNRSEDMFDEKLKEVKEVYDGCLMKLEDIPTEPKLDFKEIKEKIAEKISVGDFFVEYPHKSDTVAVIRFEKKDVAERVSEGLTSGDMKIFGEAEVKQGEMTEEEKDEFFRKLTEILLRSSHEPPNKKRKLD